MKVKVGDKLYVDGTAEEMTVTKVGNKYFEVDKSRNKFVIETLYTYADAFRGFQLYCSKQEVLDKKESERLYTKFQKEFSIWHNKKLTLDQLREIDKIITLTNGN